MRITKSTLIVALLVSVAAGPTAAPAQPSPPPAEAPAAAPAGSPVAPEVLDQLLAPIALYPDALVIQVITCAGNPQQVPQVNDWLKANPNLKGAELQEAATTQGFEESFVAIVLFPQVLQKMAEQPDWTQQLGSAFANDNKGVFASIQRLRKQAQEMGNLQTGEQQKVETVATPSGQPNIVIQPANPEIVYVPQYNPQVVYTQPPPPPPPYADERRNRRSVARRGVVGFTAGGVIIWLTTTTITMISTLRIWRLGVWRDQRCPKKVLKMIADIARTWRRTITSTKQEGYGGAQRAEGAPGAPGRGCRGEPGKPTDVIVERICHRRTQARRPRSLELRPHDRIPEPRIRPPLHKTRRRVRMQQKRRARRTRPWPSGAADGPAERTYRPAAQQSSAGGGQAKGGQAKSAQTASRGGSPKGGASAADKSGTSSSAFSGYQKGSTERASSDRGKSSVDRSNAKKSGGAKSSGGGRSGGGGGGGGRSGGGGGGGGGRGR